MPAFVVGVIVAAVAVVLFRLAAAWFKYRGNRVIRCPENHRPAGVVVDASHAAATSLGSRPELRLSQCTRWPERAGCGQECLKQIAAAPEDCLVRNIVAKWYRGKSCVACGQPIGEIDWAGSQPAIQVESGNTLQWIEISADKLEDTLMSAQAVCFACHTATTLVREHPELVIDRHRAVGSTLK